MADNLPYVHTVTALQTFVNASDPQDNRTATTVVAFLYLPDAERYASQMLAKGWHNVWVAETPCVPGGGSIPVTPAPEFNKETMTFTADHD